MIYYEIVFKNDHFIIVDKAPNVLSVPSRMGNDEHRPCLGRILEDDLKKRLYPVHRLDYEVQGLIIYALTSSAQRDANGWFEHKSIQKIYSAITKSSDNFKVGESYEWKCKLLRGKKRAYESPAGKESLTIAKLILKDEKDFFHWELRPITGRSHQLRYELYRHDMAIVGDNLYGSIEKFSAEGIALRAFEIDFSSVVNRGTYLLPEKICTKKL